MDPNATAYLWQLADRGGFVIGMILVLVGGFRRWWVFGWSYDAKDRECEQWKQLALTGHLINKDAISTLASVVKQ